MILNFILPIALASGVRHLEVKRDEVVDVKTAVGIATIIQVPDQPTSVVLGDSGAFSVEYLNQAVTIKPLRMNAASNLYIHTDFDRFTVKLVSAPPSQADYVVYIKTAAVRPPAFAGPAHQKIDWRSIHLSQVTTLGAAKLTRVGSSKDRFFIEVVITPSITQKLDPGVFWLVQEKRTIPIEELLLPSLALEKSKPFLMTVSFRKSAAIAGKPLNLEVRSQRTSTLTVPSEVLWRK